MANKLVQRYAEIQGEVELVQKAIAGEDVGEALQARIAELETKQADLKKTVLHLIALSSLRDQAWRTLSYGQNH